MPSMHQKVAQLENLVASLMKSVDRPDDIARDCTSKSPLADLAPVQPNELSDEFGRLCLKPNETTYVGVSHWMAILDGIAELKDELAEPIQPPGPGAARASTPRTSPALLYGGKNGVSKRDALAGIPPRAVSDRLISRFFNAMDMASLVLHGPTFLRDYETFWKDPQNASFGWLSLLFSVICLGIQLTEITGEELGGFPTPSHLEQADTKSLVRYFRQKTAECLVSSEYTRPGPYTIEALIWYWESEHLDSEDTRFDTCIILSIIVRTAMRAGYHRDPSHVPGLTPFQGEMRRRIWATILQLDLATSFQVGLPRLAQHEQADSAEPRNLLDNDFGPDTPELPESRPDSEPTPIGFFRARNKYVQATGALLDTINSLAPKSESELLRLENTLRAVRSILPQCYHFRSLSESLMDSPNTLLQRIYLDMMYHKGLCVIHRQCLKLGQDRTSSSRSRDICRESSLVLLTHHRTLWQEIQPGGRLFVMRWKVSSLLTHDFLLASTMLCLLVHQNIQDGIHADADDHGQADMIRALALAGEVWRNSAQSSQEARRAVNAIHFILREAGVPNMCRESPCDDYSFIEAPFGKDPDDNSDAEFLFNPFDQYGNQTLFSDISASDLDVTLDNMMSNDADWPTGQ